MPLSKVTLLSREIGNSVKGSGGEVYVADEWTSVPLIFQQLQDAGAWLSDLTIIAHSIWLLKYGGTAGEVYAYLAAAAGQSTGGLAGPYGIAIGKDKINKGNVAMFELLGGCFRDGGVINLVTCAIASTTADPPSRAGPSVWSGDGIKLCEKIAEYSGALVRASPEVQKYTIEGDGIIDAGDWDGAVYQFSPMTSGYRQVR